MGEVGLHAVERLTTRFRWETLRLCQTSDTKESWEAEQHLLDRLWEKDTKLAPSAARVLYACPACGVYVHPGLEGTSLRVARFAAVKSRRTRRRRMQRKQRRVTESQKKQGKDTNKPRNEEGNKTSFNQMSMETVLLRDDDNILFDRHHLVVQCGRCHAKIRLKGLKRDSPPTKQTVQRNQSSYGAIKHQETQGASTTTKALPSDSAAGEHEFLQLPTAAAKPGNRSKSQSIAIQADERQWKSLSMSIGNPAKKKKKKNDGNGKKSLLRSFLSSLND